MKITITPTWTRDGQERDGWGWWLHADNGATLARSVRRYQARTDAIASVLRILGLSLPKRPVGARWSQRSHQDQPRGGWANVYVLYGSGGKVTFAQWSMPHDFIELVEG